MRILTKKQTKPRVCVGDVINSPYDNLMIIKVHKNTVETQYTILDLDDMTTDTETFETLDELNRYLWDEILNSHSIDCIVIRNNRLVITSEEVLED